MKWKHLSQGSGLAQLHGDALTKARVALRPVAHPDAADFVGAPANHVEAEQEWT
jgi:hypothetical protein